MGAGTAGGGDPAVVVVGVEADDRVDELGQRTGVSVDEQDPGSGVLQGVLELGVGPPEVEGHHHAAGCGNAAVELHVGDRVERDHPNSSAALDPEFGQHGPELAGSGHELAEGHAGVAADESLLIGGDQLRSAQCMADVVHREPPQCSAPDCPQSREARQP